MMMLVDVVLFVYDASKRTEKNFVKAKNTRRRDEGALKKGLDREACFFSDFFPIKSDRFFLDYYYYEHAITDVAERQKKKKIKKRYEEEEIRVLRNVPPSRARVRVSGVFIPGKKRGNGGKNENVSHFFFSVSRRQKRACCATQMRRRRMKKTPGERCVLVAMTNLGLRVPPGAMPSVSV